MFLGPMFLHLTVHLHQLLDLYSFLFHISVTHITAMRDFSYPFLVLSIQECCKGGMGRAGG